MENQIPEYSAPRITVEQIESLLDSCVLYVGRVGDTTTTLVHVFLPGGFFLASGESSCVSPQNFNAELGIKYATEDAYRKAKDKLWELEGYRLYCDLQQVVPEVPLQ